MNTQKHTRTTEHATRTRASAPLDGADARERLLAWLPVAERRLELTGVLTTLLEGGSGPPLILLHGPFANAGHWLRVIPGLVASHRVIAPDLPGHGASRATPEALSARGIVAWLGELIAQTCASPPVLVGQTLGGAIAASFASRTGAPLSHLVLVDTFGLTPFEPQPEFAQAVANFVAQPTETTHEALWRHCAFDLDRLRERMGQRWDSFTAYNLHLAQTPSVRAAASALIGEFAPAIPVEELARIAVPTTLAWGRHDRATPLAVAEAASARFGWPLHVIEDAADDPPVEQPEALVRLLHAVTAGMPGEREGGLKHA
jgi:pimeloyl-ACP methyl ester carboxylesterase